MSILSAGKVYEVCCDTEQELNEWEHLPIFFSGLGAQPGNPYRYEVVVIELEDAATDCPMDIDEVVAEANVFPCDQLFDDDDINGLPGDS